MQAAPQHAGVMAELAQPAGHHGGAHAIAVEQHQARTAHAHVLVAGLHELAAGRVLGTGQRTGLEFLGRAHIAQEQRARSILAPGAHGVGIDLGHVEAFGQGAGLGLQRAAGRVVAIALRSAVLQRQVGQVPALGAVLQRVDGVGNAQVDQGLRADDGARAARAIDHDGRGRIGHQAAHAQRQLAIGAADGAGDVHLVELGDGPAVQHHQGQARRLARRQLLGRDARRAVGVFGQFAKGLGRQVHAGEQRVARSAPGLGTAFEHGDPGVAQGFEAARGALGHARAGIALATVVGDDATSSSSRL